jgi:hypothetical protein
MAKMAAFDRFRRSTTHWKSIAMLLLAPIPGLLWTLLMECTPMGSTAPPRSAWYVCWPWVFRHFMGGFVGSILTLRQMREYIPAIAFPWSTILSFAFFQGTICIGTNLVIMAGTGKFPVPFSQFTSLLPMHMVGTVIGRRIIRQQQPPIPNIEQRYPQVVDIVNAQTLPIFLYPIYAAVFMQLSSHYQTGFLLFLPMLRNATRYFIWKKSKHDEDIAGGATSASGQLFHVLFTATCLQNAKSLKTLVVIVAWNAVYALTACQELLQTSADISHLRLDWKEPRSIASGAQPQPEADLRASGVTRPAKPLAPSEPGCQAVIPPNDNVSFVLAVLSDAEIATALDASDPLLLLSSFHAYQVDWISTIADKLRVSRTETQLLSSRENYDRVRDEWRRKLQTSKRARRSVERRNALTLLVHHPIETLSGWSTHRRASGLAQILPSTSIADISNVLPPQQENIGIQSTVAFVNEVAFTLHRTEMLLLRSYVTISSMLFYSIYILVVFHLPNREYYLTMKTMTTLDATYDTIRSLIIVAASEAGALALYLAVIRQRLGYSGLEQIAFVLSSQDWLMQARFITLPVIILSFPLHHAGTDLVYEFLWFGNTTLV